MTLDEQQRKFEEAIIDMSVVEHHRYCMYHKRAKNEADARMFYTAMKIGVTKGMEYATKQIIEHNKDLENGN